MHRRNVSGLAIGRVETRQVEFGANLFLEKLHFAGFAVNEHDVFRFAVLNELHDAFGVGVRREGHVLDAQFHV